MEEASGLKEVKMELGSLFSKSRFEVLGKVILR
jgi:hypothetical protein